ncbi:MAG: thiol:disulfide interchange protein DsbA/DsbL [Thiobacillus sp.]|nr:thiol:disulfide interchange protein DsbA/DsbL [Thiobacillus sp.]
MFRRALAFVAAAVFSLSAFAVEPISEGHDYTLVQPPRAAAPGNKVEVLEFFWYRCPHCFQLEPGLAKWLKTLPKDTQIRRVPAVFRPDWLPASKLYYTLEQMKLLDRLHEKVFNAYHIDNLDLDNPAVLGSWVAKQGVNRKQFEALYTSFAIQSKATQGAQLATTYAIRGVPAFIVDGKYATSVSQTGSETRLFEVLDQLIAKARAERAHKKAK